MPNYKINQKLIYTNFNHFAVGKYLKVENEKIVICHINDITNELHCPKTQIYRYNFILLLIIKMICKIKKIKI